MQKGIGEKGLSKRPVIYMKLWFNVVLRRSRATEPHSSTISVIRTRPLIVVYLRRAFLYHDNILKQPDFDIRDVKSKEKNSSRRSW